MDKGSTLFLNNIINPLFFFFLFSFFLEWTEKNQDFVKHNTNKLSIAKIVLAEFITFTIVFLSMSSFLQRETAAFNDLKIELNAKDA